MTPRTRTARLSLMHSIARSMTDFIRIRISADTAKGERVMDDTISRQAAIDAIQTHKNNVLGEREWDEGMAYGYAAAHRHICDVIAELPSARPEVRPIDYQDCSNAMLRMWLDNVVTDGEYNRIMDKLNAHWGKNDG